MKLRGLLAIGLVLHLSVMAPAQEQAAVVQLAVRASQMEDKDPVRATAMYEQAAQQGYAPAMVMLGYRLLHGLGARQDYDRAFSMFSNAAHAGNMTGQMFQAMSYLQGLGTRKDPMMARQLLLLPADRGEQMAQYTLAIMMMNGEGGPKREAAARRWLDRASQGPGADVAARAANYRDQLDKKLFSTDDSMGQALTALLFVSLVGMAMGGGGSAGSSGSMSSPGGFGGGGMPQKAPCVPRLAYPNNITKTVNGNLTDPGLIHVGC